MKKTKKTIQHDYECQTCGKPATCNIQQTWHEYEITPKGDFKEINSWEGDNNYFYCDDHEDDHEYDFNS
jgi:hypothetical protein